MRRLGSGAQRALGLDVSECHCQGRLGCCPQIPLLGHSRLDAQRNSSRRRARMAGFRKLRLQRCDGLVRRSDVGLGGSASRRLCRAGRIRVSHRALQLCRPRCICLGSHEPRSQRRRLRRGGVRASVRRVALRRGCIARRSHGRLGRHSCVSRRRHLTKPRFRGSERSGRGGDIAAQCCDLLCMQGEGSGELRV